MAVIRKARMGHIVTAVDMEDKDRLGKREQEVDVLMTWMVKDKDRREGRGEPVYREREGREKEERT